MNISEPTARRRARPLAEVSSLGARRPVLIVNADDFGMTPGVSEGILQAFERGIVTSTSALVIAPAFDRYAASLRDSGLAVGAHLAVVGEDRPLLTAREVPSLVDLRGRFPLTWQQFVRRAARGVVDTDDLRRELAAQVERLLSYGIVVSHLDSHQNLHLWPQVATVVLELARERRIDAIRVCRAARWNPTAIGVRTLSAQLRRRATANGLVFPGASTAVDETGGRGPTGLVTAIERMASLGVASAELVSHLGLARDPERARYRSRFDWAGELDAVCDPALPIAVERAGFRLGSFADLTEREPVGRSALAVAEG